MLFGFCSSQAPLRTLPIATSVGRLNFASVEPQKTIEVLIIDEHVEGAETSLVVLSNASGVAIEGTPSATTVTIRTKTQPECPTQYELSRIQPTFLSLIATAAAVTTQRVSAKTGLKLICE